MWVNFIKKEIAESANCVDCKKLTYNLELEAVMHINLELANNAQNTETDLNLTITLLEQDVYKLKRTCIEVFCFRHRNLAEKLME